MDAPDDNIYNPQSQLSRSAFIVGSLAAGFALAVLPVTDLPEGIHGQTTLFHDRRPIVKIAGSIYKTRSDHRVRNHRMPRIRTRVARPAMARSRCEQSRGSRTSLELLSREHHQRSGERLETGQNDRPVGLAARF